MKPLGSIPGGTKTALKKIIPKTAANKAVFLILQNRGTHYFISAGCAVIL
jgi:hypothetical protein